MNNQDKFSELRKKYPEFIYEKYDISFKENNLEIKYHFTIPGLTSFYPEIKIPKEYIKEGYNEEYLEYLVFHIGLIELISYCKCTCSKNIIIKPNYIDQDQIKFLKKLYYNGLGEFLYINGITVKEADLFNITCLHEEKSLPNIVYKGNGNLICVGGGKDSCVSLEILKNEKDNSCLLMNVKTPSLESCYQAGYKDKDIIKVARILDRKIVELNNQGFLNGHTPLSSVIAFISYLCAYLSKKKYIVLSNESSANEPTVIGTNINHQYSKTYEFEKDFTNYMNKYIKLDIKYFSLLRGLSEYNIAHLFSNYKKYHKVFKSCNLGSKNEVWDWCGNCSKCLFIYIILSPFLSKEEQIEIFHEDLYARKDLLKTFKELIGYSTTKPFECVGTYSEARLAVSQVINNFKGELPYLLAYYKNNYPLELDNKKILQYNDENNIPCEYNDLVKEELKKYV